MHPISEIYTDPKRLQALNEYAILDTPPEDTFDGFTLLAAQICQTPTALLTLVDHHRQWFKSRINFELMETAREISFCAHALLQPSEVFVIPDTLIDERFARNPLVMADPHIRFYAGVPLLSPEGHPLGTLCVIDHQPRTLSPEHQKALRILSRQVMTELELRRRSRELLKASEVIARQAEAAEALRRSEALFHTLAKAAPVGIFRTDGLGDCTYVNEQWTKITGLSLAAAEGKGWAKSLHPDDQGRVFQRWYRAVETGLAFQAEYRFLHPDGQVTWVLGQGLREQPSTLQPSGYVGTITDITERKETEDKLRESEELLRRVMASSEDCIKVLDLQGRLLIQNECGRRLMEVDDFKEVSGSLWPDSWPEEARTEVGAALALAQAGKPGKFTAFCPTYKGTPRWWDVIVSPILDSTGAPEKILSISRDVTERKRIERLLAWEKSALELIGARLPLHQVLEKLMIDLEVQMPAARCSVLLLEPDGQHFKHGAAPSLPVAYCRAVEGAMIGPTAGSCGTAMYSNGRVIASDIRSDPLWADYKDLALQHGLRACWSTPLHTSARQVVGSFAIYYQEPRAPTPIEIELIDRASHIVSLVIERKRAEEALQLSGERLQLVGRATNDAVWDWDLQTNLVWWNEGFQSLFGYAPAEIEPGIESRMGRTHPNDVTRVKEGIYQVISGGGASWKDEYRFRRSDGSYADILDRGYIIHAPDGKAIRMIGAMIDLSERKRTEQALRASEERFRQLAENITEVFWVRDVVKEQFLYVSPAFANVWARKRDSLYKSAQIWEASIYPEDRPQFMRAVAEKQQRGDYDETYRIVRPDGGVRWIRDRAYPVRTPEGNVYRIVGIAEDVTERKIMEAQFLQAQRMETVGQLAGGVAHDINNILAPIMISVALLRLEMEQSEVERTLNMIEASARRGAEVVKQLLLFGRGAEGQRSVVRLAEVIEEIGKIIRKSFLKNIILHVSVPPEVWPLYGDPTRLHQVLLNLCVNARDAMPEGGDLTVEAQNLQLDANDAVAHPEAHPGPYVRLSVTDCGTGISNEVIGRIFDPFFTTKAIGQGTGLGLSTVLGIVKSHGGFVKVSSKLGQGSTFHVYLPATPGTAQPDPVTLSALPPRGHGELILVVDDEEYIRDTISQTLIRHGYRVETASDGMEATVLFDRHASEIQTVLSDIDMPSLDGAKMLQILREKNPKLKVIVSSGIGDSTMSKARTSELKALGINTFLAKPYTAEKILWVVHDLLAK